MVETLSEAIEAITFGTKANTSSWIKRAGRSLMIFSARATRGRRKMRRAAWSSSCSRNAHDQNVRAWDKARLGALGGWAGEKVVRNRGSTRLPHIPSITLPLDSPPLGV